MNEEVWERKERERREEETEREDAVNLERFKREKLSIRQEGEEDPRTGQKRKRGVAGLEDETPVMVDADQHERVGEGQHEHGQHPPEVQHQVEQQEPLLAEDIMHGVSGSEPLLEMDRVQVEQQQQHQRLEDDQDGQDGLHVRADEPKGLYQHHHVVDDQGGQVGHRVRVRAGEVKIRKEMEYSLGCWSLWWKRMEREGVKEGMARRAKNMQHPMKYFMQGGCSDKIANIAKKLETHTRTETVTVKMLISNSCQKTTLQKRKSHSSMNPESTLY